jgi:hypothetical protein
MPSDDNKQWYTNKDLFELINHMQGDFRDLRSEMKETRSAIKKYNGLREEVGSARKEIDGVKEEVEIIRAMAKGRSSVWTDVRLWGGWIVAFLTMLAALGKVFLT